MSSAAFSRDVLDHLRRSPESYPWKRGVPFQQPFHVFSEADQAWHAIEKSSRQSTSTDPIIDSFTVLSWNIDFSRMLPDERMTAALEHLRTHVTNKATESEISFGPATTLGKNIIMLNEMTQSDLQIIQCQDWIRNEFQITDLSNKFWESHVYGTCMLIPRRMVITNVFRVHYEVTNMGRDALFVDVDINGKIIRLCSTHLESLIATPPKRPQQLSSAARYLHEADAGILGGDLNAIQDFDKSLHLDNDLKDAYLETNHSENAWAGMTWGQMAATSSRERFGLTRMDKFFFCGAVQIEYFGRFGMDVQVEKKIDRRRLINSGLEKGWVTDHLGIKAIFRLIL